MMEQRGAREAAKRLFKKYNFQGGHLSNYQLSSMMDETYHFLNIPFKPSTKDIKSYERVLDLDRDGRVTVNDLESFAIMALCGNGMEPEKISNLTSYSINREPTQKNINSYGHSYTSIYTQSKQNKQTFQPEQQSDYSYSTQYVQSTTYHNQPQTYQNQSQTYQNVPQTYQQEPQTYQNEQQFYQRQYSQKVKQYLAVVGQVFLRYADPQHYFVTENEVADLLSDTYTVLGREGYVPSRDDVSAWMKLCDVNNDGRVQFQQYEFFVVKSLERSGMNLYDD